jgi:enoyl-CoA hydratase/carnithine racemase
MNQGEKIVSYQTIIYEKKNAVAIRFAKSFINRVSMLDADMRLELAIMYSLAESTSDDAQEGPRAFSEKRKPVFKGR